MSGNDWIQIVVFVVTLLLLVKPCGLYFAAVYSGKLASRSSLFDQLERWIARCCGYERDEEMDFKAYSRSVLVFSFIGFLVVFGIQRMQAWLPLNPESLPNISSDSAFNTAISFVTNTNWQGYGGESTMSYFTQMIALTVQNFVSAAAGMAVLVALIRGFQRASQPTLGSFWVDLMRGVVFILLPMSIVFALVLVSQGVVQTLEPYREVATLEPMHAVEHPNELQKQVIALGPVASQIAIKQLGTNGGGFFNANSAHPFENPNSITNFLELIAILLIPAALCYTFGEMIGDRRQGLALLAAMSLILVPLLVLETMAERSVAPKTFEATKTEQPESKALAGGEEKTVGDRFVTDRVDGVDWSGGNMEGKEVRFGIVGSSTWAIATTAASNGSVNAMHDSFTPLGGLLPLWLIQLGEVVFGGVGSGLYGMIVFAIIAVFIAGLMVGRTPEYLGKKIGAYEIKMAMIVVLLPCACVLIGTAISVSVASGKSSIFNPGPHGFSEVLYAWSSAGNNNGSAFAGLGANTPFYNGWLGIAMLLGRFGVILPVLAIASSLASKKRIPAGPGTLPTHSPLFVMLLVSIVLIVGALTFFPSLALGPIVEQMQS